MTDRRILTSKQEIMDYCGFSDRVFREFVKIGLPCMFFNNRWYAFSENIDGFFKTVTMRNNAALADEEIEKGE